MAWRYRQSTGHLTRRFLEGNEELIAIGYSGHDQGLNNPMLQALHSIGPIPAGRYTIGPAYESQLLGDVVLPLNPTTETHTFGRGYFRIHGDNLHGDKTASRGCIVLARSAREAIRDSSDNELEVYP